MNRSATLTGGPRSAPERHRSLHNTMEWSFQLLDADERHVLCRLAPFRGGCDLESVEAVCAVELPRPTDVLQVLMNLVDKSLVTTVHSDCGTRYELHETIREYCLGSCSDAERAAIEQRHASWFAEMAFRLSEGPAEDDERAWIRRHDVERDNVRAAAAVAARARSAQRRCASCSTSSQGWT